ncbi:MAG: type IV pilus twitching motility protein PilT [Myxococcales bacterium]|nr:type IV pilus twitching motility protein PilT [Myxococcales bacterium]
MSTIDELLKMMVSQGASDLHFVTGQNPMFRLSGRIEPLRHGTINEASFVETLRPIVPEAIWGDFHQSGDADFAYSLEGVARYRVNLFRQEKGSGAVFRVIPSKIMTLETLGVPEQVKRFAEMTRGLVLVTGPTGSGKSTTLSAVINQINESRAVHIVTIEDPIEFVHPNKRALISQREVGAHATSFADALKAAVREDPDVILVGEMRDLETIRMALHSAETGVLVFGTLHTNGASRTIDRMINVFPVDEQETVRATIAETLRGVIAQQLIPRVGGGRVAAYEVLFAHAALSNIIREGKTHMIESMIKTGQRLGMVSMDDALKRLVADETIDPKDGLGKAINKEEFRKFLRTQGYESEEGNDTR